MTHLAGDEGPCVPLLFRRSRHRLTGRLLHLFCPPSLSFFQRLKPGLVPVQELVRQVLSALPRHQFPGNQHQVNINTLIAHGPTVRGHFALAEDIGGLAGGAPDLRYRHLDHHLHCCVAMGTLRFRLFRKVKNTKSSHMLKDILALYFLMNEAAQNKKKVSHQSQHSYCVSFNVAQKPKNNKIALCHVHCSKEAPTNFIGPFTLSFSQLTICFVPGVEGNATEA